MSKAEEVGDAALNYASVVLFVLMGLQLIVWPNWQSVVAFISVSGVFALQWYLQWRFLRQDESLEKLNERLLDIEKRTAEVSELSKAVRAEVTQINNRTKSIDPADPFKRGR